VGAVSLLGAALVSETKEDVSSKIGGRMEEESPIKMGPGGYMSDG